MIIENERFFLGFFKVKFLHGHYVREGENP